MISVREYMDDARIEMPQEANQSHNVNTSHATKIFKTYGNDSIEVVKEKPALYGIK